MENGPPPDARTGLPLHTPIAALVPADFHCERRDGSHAVVPRGSCEIELGSHFAAICWESPEGRHRVEISLQDLVRLLNEDQLELPQARQPGDGFGRWP
jgi:hypothetical protein